MPSFDPVTFFATAGALFLAMPATVWVLLHERHPRRQVDLWCLGGLLFAVTLLLYGLRGRVDPLWSIHVANGCACIAALLMWAVLRLEGGLAARPGRLVVIGLVVLGSMEVADQVGPLARQAVVNGWYAVLAAAQVRETARLAQLRRSRAAALMAVLFALTSASAAFRAVLFGAGLSNADAFQTTLSFQVMSMMSMAGAVVANIGYMGLALDRARDRSVEQSHALDSLREHQQSLELAARTREAVANERARTTRLLAHEVRQPLHNAAVALQSGVATLARSRDAVEVARAIEQAQSVIRKVSATLDNTVAATTLLAAQGRISTADTDLQMLVELCLADLPPESRPRVQVDYQADARSARLEPSLLRLAVRNLLVNATLYAPADTPVVLRVLDSDEPLALVIEVADQGPGIDDALRERLFEEGVRGNQSTVPGYGLGLHVVRRVANLHGGSIEWRPNQPRGSVFRLMLPQGDPG